MREVDRYRIISMGSDFISATTYADVFRELVPDGDLILGIDRLIGLGFEHPEISACFVAERDGKLVGMIALAIGPHLLTGKTFAEELVWWVDPNSRGRVGLELLNAAEAWAQEAGAAFLKMIAPIGAGLEVLYAHRGYREIETAFAKRL